MRKRHPTPPNLGEQNKRISNSPSSRALELLGHWATRSDRIPNHTYHVDHVPQQIVTVIVIVNSTRID
jgi:hypothetical protein